MTIAYTILEQPLGHGSHLGAILLAATPRGVCSIQLGSSADSLASGLARELPHATLQRDDRALAAQLTALRALLAGQALEGAALPIDVQATAFQWQVWTALMAIPRGQTRTYTEVARAIDRPRAVRAVARACATNPVAVVIPCHRVVPSEGGVGGYRWGTISKQALLELESSGDGSTKQAVQPALFPDSASVEGRPGPPSMGHAAPCRAARDGP